MCGIGGKISPPSRRVTKSSMFGMLKALEHRGPESQDIYLQGNVGLCHSRLKIIDLSDVANQPIPNEDKSIWIVFNGEIYNYQKWRQKLIEKGHRFRSESDTEVIVHLYEEYKEACLDYLRGMFAFAIWDERDDKLFLARDRLGQKPLKYYMSGGTFIFASELKAILSNQEVAKKIDHDAVNSYLMLGYVPTPQTGFEGIKKLPAAHYMTLQNGKLKIKRYWKLDYSQTIHEPEEELTQRIRDKLIESVRLRLISDVPLGMHLSGGIDSAAIAAIMTQLLNNPVKTFSIGYENSSYSELEEAEHTAQVLGTDHHEFVIQPDIVDLLPKLSWHYEEPFADIAAIPYFYLSEQTKRHVTVALNGDGGDENFGGYSKYRHILLIEKLGFIPSSLRRLASKFLSLGSGIKPVNTLSRIIDKDPFEIYFALNRGLSASLLDEFYKDRLKERQFTDIRSSYYEIFSNSGSGDLLDRLTYLDFMTYLPDDLTVKVDIATMAFALEARSPMLDHEFVELCASVPDTYKIKNGREKYIFRRSLEKLLPEEILKRRKKAFIAPYGKWFKDDLGQYLREILLDEQNFIIQKFFKRQPIARILEEHAEGKLDHTFNIYKLLMLEHWGRAFKLK